MAMRVWGLVNGLWLDYDVFHIRGHLNTWSPSLGRLRRNGFAGRSILLGVAWKFHIPLPPQCALAVSCCGLSCEHSGIITTMPGACCYASHHGSDELIPFKL